MKRPITLLLLATLALAPAWAQQRDAAELFARLMHRSGKNFVYPAGLLDGLTLDVRLAEHPSLPLPQLLDSLFAPTDISWRIRGNNVILTRRGSTTPAKVTLCGFIREASTLEPIADAVVRAARSGSLTTTNAQGFYAISFPAGAEELLVSYVGFEPYAVPERDYRTDAVLNVGLSEGHRLSEVEIVATRQAEQQLTSTDVGRLSLSGKTTLSTPVIFGESDVIKTLQLQPGVTQGLGGFAGMHVHGGSQDENLYMIDNVPLYQINHSFGLFSAFNTEAIRNVDFYKASFPARYDGRLASFVDVQTKEGSPNGTHGSLRLGTTSGAVNLNGPLGSGRTTYSVAMRRSWLDLLTTPIIKNLNRHERDEAHGSDYENYDFRYAFLDLNAKLTHRISDRTQLYLMAYYGDDMIRSGETDYGGIYSMDEVATSTVGTELYRMRWGNAVASAGWKQVISPKLFSELTLAWTRYSARLNAFESLRTDTVGGGSLTTSNRQRTDNHINDLSLRADFDWRPAGNHRASFGASLTSHSFLPGRYVSVVTSNPGETFTSTDSTRLYRAAEANLYAGDEWSLSRRLTLSGGLHLSLFGIDGKLRGGISPRLSARWDTQASWTLKGGYSRTVQYVHQLTQSYLSLPTDQWIPIAGRFRPQRADQLFVGAYRDLGHNWSLSAEGWWRWMNGLIEYVDDYYLIPQQQLWLDRLCSGRGTAKGVDFKLGRQSGRLNGFISYGLMWADRTFAERNGGLTYPARNDNRHKLNLFLDWRASRRWEISAAWVGMSGNRITLATDSWMMQMPDGLIDAVPLQTQLNNYRLPFYHRLDLNFRRHTKHGYWDFSFYNAYCNMLTVTVVRDYDDDLNQRAFRELRMIPIIPSLAYTWTF